MGCSKGDEWYSFETQGEQVVGGGRLDKQVVGLALEGWGEGLKGGGGGSGVAKEGLSKEVEVVVGAQGH